MTVISFRTDTGQVAQD